MITQRLVALAAFVDMENQLALFDVNKHCEIFYAALLNRVYGWHLKPLNSKRKQNYPAIDLGDAEARLAAQVTSDSSREKVKDTLKKFHKHELFKEYSTLKIVVITAKGEFKKEFESFEIAFTKEQDIIDVSDILNAISEIREAKALGELASFIEDELAKPSARARIECNEVETIMAVIQFLSDDSLVPTNEHDESAPDPEGKIKRRFEEHSGFLIEEFQGLMPLYEDKFNQAVEACGLDAVRTKKISLFLKRKSDAVLTACNDDPCKALDQLTVFFGDKVANRCIGYDDNAIRYFLIKELIKCNVFPNKD